jgi:hypothetical protein
MVEEGLYLSLAPAMSTVCTYLFMVVKAHTKRLDFLQRRCDGYTYLGII